MPDLPAEPALDTTPTDKPAYRPHPQLAKAIRSETEAILDLWWKRTLLAVPNLPQLRRRDFTDDIGRILKAMADALESNDPPDLHKMMQVAPAHGFQRFTQDYNLTDLFAEERILRQVVVERVEFALARRCDADEATALHAMIDIMIQQGVLALVSRQKEDLREAAEAELKYASFISHDFGNSFFVIRSNLEWLQQRLTGLAGMEESARTLEATLQVISRTQKGMRALLSYERLRGSSESPKPTPIRLREAVEPIVQLESGAAGSVVTEIDISAEAAVRADPGLLNILLQNLIGNALKSIRRKNREAGAGGGGGGGGKVRVAARRDDPQAVFWTISIIDTGPGIPPSQIPGLFEPFKRLAACEPPPAATPAPSPNPDHEDQVHENQEEGFGLGLAIAKQAAMLMGTTIDVQSRVGEGSTFSFKLPAAPPDP